MFYVDLAKCSDLFIAYQYVSLNMQIERKENPPLMCLPCIIVQKQNILLLFTHNENEVYRVCYSLIVIIDKCNIYMMWYMDIDP